MKQSRQTKEYHNQGFRNIFKIHNTLILNHVILIAKSSTQFAKLNETTNCHKRSRIFLQRMFLRGFLLKFRKWKLIRESTSVTIYKNKLFFKTMFIFKTSVIDINESLCYGVWFWSDAIKCKIHKNNNVWRKYIT